MKIRFLAVLAILPFLLAGPIKAAPPTVTTELIDTVIPAGCSGEDIHVTGELTQSFSITTKNGITHFVAHLHGHLDGVGLTTGDTYSVNVSENEEENFKGPADEANVVIREVLISHGGSPNENIKLSEHFTINANGDVVVDRFDFSDDCVG